MGDIVAWHGKTLDEHVKLRDAASKNGYRFLSLSIHGTTGSPHYTAVMIKRPVIVAQRDWPLLTADEFQNVFNDQAQKGYGPVMISAAGSSSDPRFAAVFQPQAPIPLTRHRLRSGTDDDLNTIQGMNKFSLNSGCRRCRLALVGYQGLTRLNRYFEEDQIKAENTQHGAAPDAADAARAGGLGR
jgi:hypothetical protein